jgi:hypothetical protein
MSKETNEERQAFCDGYRAALERKNINVNPYSGKYLWLHEKWREGHCKGTKTLDDFVEVQDASEL